MAFTQSDLDALDDAIKTGAKEVRFQDRVVTYQDTDAMMRARTLISGILGTNVKRITRVFTSKGL